MDEKYIQNLGMSPFVDEGLWDKWKARAAGYAQAAKNIAASGTTPQQTAQFRSLFKTFSANTVKTLTDFLKVIYPYWKSGKLTPEEQGQTDAMFALKTALENIKQDVTEANMFTRPFSALGAQASGKASNIIAAYQKILKGYFDTFSKDARALGMDPVQVFRQHHPDLYPMIQQTLGIPAVSPTTPPAPPAPTPAPASTPPPSATTPPPSPTPVPVPSPAPETPPSPVAPAGGSTATSSPVAPAAPTPAPGTLSAAPTGTPTMRVTSTGNMLYSLTAQTINKLISTLQEGKNMLKRIKSEGTRMRNKTVVEFDLDNPPIKAEKNGYVYKWALQYRYNKSNDSHCFDVALITTDPRGQTREASTWMPFIEFKDLDVISVKDLGRIRSDFDVISNIEKANPKLGKILKDSMAAEGETLDPTVNGEIAKVFTSVASAMDPESIERNVRARKGAEGDDEDADAPEKTGGGAGTEAPPAAPVAPTPEKPGEPAPPEAAARTVTAPMVKPKAKPVATGVARSGGSKKTSAKTAGKTAKVAAPVATTPKPAPKKKVAKPGSKKPVVKGRHSVTEEFSPNFKDFFPL